MTERLQVIEKRMGYLYTVCSNYIYMYKKTKLGAYFPLCAHTQKLM